MWRRAILSLVRWAQASAALAVLAHVVHAHFGIAAPKLAAWPAWATLTLCSLRPIVRNTATAFFRPDSTLHTAAQALRMNRIQTFWYVAVPQALPVVVGGLRVASVWALLLSAWVAPIGTMSVGEAFCRGDGAHLPGAAVVGCGVAAVMALGCHLMLRQCERRLQNHRGVFVAAGLVLLLSLAGAAVGAHAVLPPYHHAMGLRIGAQAGPMHAVVQHLVAQQLANEAGVPVQMLPSTTGQWGYEALVAGKIDIFASDVAGLCQRLAHQPAYGRTRPACSPSRLRQRLTHDGIAVVAALGTSPKVEGKAAAHRASCCVHDDVWVLVGRRVSNNEAAVGALRRLGGKISHTQMQALTVAATRLLPPAQLAAQTRAAMKAQASHLIDGDLSQ